jgi:hypothetical protein
LQVSHDVASLLGTEPIAHGSHCMYPEDTAELTYPLMQEHNAIFVAFTGPVVLGPQLPQLTLPEVSWN